MIDPYNYFLNTYTMGSESLVTIFRQINVPGAVTQDEPLSLSDFDETHCADS